MMLCGVDGYVFTMNDYLTAMTKGPHECSDLVELIR